MSLLSNYLQKDSDELSLDRFACAAIQACRAEVESGNVSKVGPKTKKSAALRCANLLVKFRAEEFTNQELNNNLTWHRSAREVIQKNTARCYEKPSVFS